MNYDIWPGIGLSVEPIDWAKFFGSAALSAKSTANVERRRQKGADFSTIRGLSVKSEKQMKLGAPKRMRKRGSGNGGVGGRPLVAGSKSAQIRAALANGPMTRAQICAAVGIKSSTTSAYLFNDIKQGRILKIENEGGLQTFALAGGAHA